MVLAGRAKRLSSAPMTLRTNCGEMRFSGTQRRSKPWPWNIRSTISQVIGGGAKR